MRLGKPSIKQTCMFYEIWQKGRGSTEQKPNAVFFLLKASLIYFTTTTIFQLHCTAVHIFLLFNVIAID